MIIVKKISQFRKYGNLIATAFFSLALMLILGFAKPVSVNAQENKTKWDWWHEVTRVVDGDTVKALVDGKVETIRIIGMNSPEINKPQCYGAESSAKAKEFLNGKWIKLEEDKSQSSRDKYNRLLAYVWFDEGTDFGRRMIEEGYAFEYTYAKPYKYQDQYRQTQQQSKDNQFGLWSPKTCNGKIGVSKPKPKVSKPKATVAPKPIQVWQPAYVAPVKRAAPKPAPVATSSGIVKKSKSSGICHAPGTTYYNRTTHYYSFNNIQACLNSGGRLPKR